jgi:hypothetical protein
MTTQQPEVYSIICHNDRSRKIRADISNFLSITHVPESSQSSSSDFIRSHSTAKALDTRRDCKRSTYKAATRSLFGNTRMSRQKVVFMLREVHRTTILHL